MWAAGLWTGLCDAGWVTAKGTGNQAGQREGSMGRTTRPNGWVLYRTVRRVGRALSSVRQVADKGNAPERVFGRQSCSAMRRG